MANAFVIIDYGESSIGDIKILLCNAYATSWLSVALILFLNSNFHLLETEKKSRSWSAFAYAQANFSPELG